MASVKRIFGINEFNPASLDIIMLNENAEPANFRKVETSGNKFKEIASFDESRILALSIDSQGNYYINVVSSEGVEGDYRVPQDSRMQGLFADKSDKKVYCGDSKNKEVLIWDDERKLIERIAVNSMPVSYARQGDKLFMGTKEGKLFCNWKEFGEIDGTPYKLEIVGKQLVVVNADFMKGKKIPLNAEVFDLNSLSKNKESGFSGRLFSDVVSDNGEVYSALRNEIRRHSETGKVLAKKKIKFPKGFISSINPLRIRDQNFIIYNTGLDGTCITNGEFSNSSEESNCIVDKHYDMIVVI